MRAPSGEYDQVELAYTQFLSAGSQKVSIRQFMPLDTSVLEDGAIRPPTISCTLTPKG